MILINLIYIIIMCIIFDDFDFIDRLCGNDLTILIILDLI